jgi:hypothetical protein
VRGLRVLIIGRHAEVLERTLASLKKLPIKTAGALTDDQAAELLESNQYDVVSIGGGVDGASRIRLKQILVARMPSVQLIEVPRPDTDARTELAKPAILMNGPDDLAGILTGIVAGARPGHAGDEDTRTR